MHAMMMHPSDASVHASAQARIDAAVSFHGAAAQVTAHAAGLANKAEAVYMKATQAVCAAKEAAAQMEKAQAAMTRATAAKATLPRLGKVDKDEGEGEACVFVKSLTRKERDAVGRKNAVVID
jgi:hypothetical protein